MNEKLLKKVLSTDPREKRDLTDAEIQSVWRDRRLIGLVFKWAVVISSLVFAYWYAFERGEKFRFARRLPVKGRWSLGIAIAAVFFWLAYSFFGYRCPRCARHVGLDWGMGGWLLGGEEPEKVCRNCNAHLD
jgi:hypothetical protein